MPAKKEPPYTYTVEGSKYGEFPLDMLRRDESRAASPEDQALIDRLVAYGGGKDDLPKRVKVTLQTDCRQFPPNIERWSSFGWVVIASDHPRNYQDQLGTKFRHVDELREKTMKKLASEVVRLRGLVHAAEPAYNAIRNAADVAGKDAPYRQQAIGYLSATQQIMASGLIPAVVSRKDIYALNEALKDPEVKNRFETLGAEPVGPERQGPDVLRAHLKAEIDRWAR